MHPGGTGAEKQVPCSQREISDTMGKFQNPILGSLSWPEGDKESTQESLGQGEKVNGGEKRREGKGRAVMRRVG